MMNNCSPKNLSVIEFAQLIRKRPGMYFGNEITLTNLNNLLFGFDLNAKVKSIPPFEYFNIWFCKKLKMESNAQHWIYKLLNKYNNDEKKAFEAFYELLDEFILIKPLEIIETDLLRENFSFYYSTEIGRPYRCIGSMLEKGIIEPAPYHIKLIRFDSFIVAYFFDFNYVTGDSKKGNFYYKDFKTINMAKQIFSELFGQLEWKQTAKKQVQKEFEDIIKNS